MPVNSDDTSEAEVDCGAEESGPDGQGDKVPVASGKDWFRHPSYVPDLHQEKIHAFTQRDSGGVAENLQYQTADHTNKKAPSPISNAEKDLER